MDPTPERVKSQDGIMTNSLSLKTMRARAKVMASTFADTGNAEYSTQTAVWSVGAEICERLDELIKILHHNEIESRDG